MSIVDIFSNGGSVAEGLKAFQGKQEYLIAFDQEDVICYFYNTDSGKAILEMFLKENNYNVNIDIRKMTLKKDNEFFELNIGKKLVILDEKIVLYQDVIKLAETIEVHGYKAARLKNGVNIFNT